MESIKYILTLDDCRDYVKFQRKIPRIRKFLFKQFRPMLFICLGVVLIALLLFGWQILSAMNAISAEYSMTLAGVVKSDFFIPLLTYSLDEFMTLFIPIMILWGIIFLLAGSISKYDLFHAESQKVFNLMKGQDLDIEVIPEADGLFCRGEHSKTVYYWQKIKDIYDTNKSFLVFVGDYSALVIPKRAFPTEEKAQEFFNFVNNNLNQK